jgi:circadian clock protein KaiC
MLETNGERNRLLYVLKSRGMAHSNQMREFLLTDGGIQLRDVYVGPGAVLTGSARLTQEARDKDDGLAEQVAAARRERDLVQEQASLKAQAAALLARVGRIKEELQTSQQQARRRGDAVRIGQRALARARQAD